MKIFQKLFITLFSLLGIFTATVIVNATVVKAQEEVVPVPMELNGTEWEVEMVYVSEKGKKDTNIDTLKFSNKQFISIGFEDNGYAPTNYSLTVQEDGTTKFGTMQIKGKETSFWKGTVTSDVIDGSVHTQFANGSTKTTYFTGKLISGVLRPQGEEPEIPPVAVPAVTDPIAESPKADQTNDMKEVMPDSQNEVEANK